MTAATLVFERPSRLQATAPPERRGLHRDAVKLLVSTAKGHTHRTFVELPELLRPGDLLVVNRSGTLAASLPASRQGEPFLLNLSTRYGPELWLSEPRWAEGAPGPLPLNPGEVVRVGDSTATLITAYPGLPRLWFVRFHAPVETLLHRFGRPIRYGYLQSEPSLDDYQTLFADTPGSAEMPSAARPFTPRVVTALKERGVGLAAITLHTGVSSLEVETETLDDHVLFPEPFVVTPATAAAVNRVHADNGRVIAVGTTVVRALESAWNAHALVARQGFTRHFVRPGQAVGAVNGLLTGFHDPKASHLALLHALAGETLIRAAYVEAVRHGYLWHEFGDSHLILPGTRRS